MKKYVLDGFKFTTKEESFDYIKDVMEFPEYFGNNLDALWDILTDMDDTYIVIENAREIPRQLGEYGLKILDVFGDIIGEYDVKVKMRW